MNILFYCEDIVIDKAGGVQNVTAFWQNYFTQKGYKASIVYRKNHNELYPSIPQIQLPYASHLKSGKNVDFLCGLIKKKILKS